MRTKNNKKCLCCSEIYTFCLHCSEFDNLPRWMNIFHNENCKNLFNITNDYKAGSITAEEAKVAFSKCDLSYRYKLNKSILDAINEVNRSSKKKAVKEKKQEISEVAEVTEIEKLIEPAVVETEVETVVE